MQGNLWEWVQNQVSGSTFPVKNNDSRVLRGGSFFLQSPIVRAANRGLNVPTVQFNDFGFRPAKTLPLVRNTPAPLTAAGSRN